MISCSKPWIDVGAAGEDVHGVMPLNQPNVFIEAAEKGNRLFHAVHIDTLFKHAGVVSFPDERAVRLPTGFRPVLITKYIISIIFSFVIYYNLQNFGGIFLIIKKIPYIPIYCL